MATSMETSSLPAVFTATKILKESLNNSLHFLVDKKSKKLCYKINFMSKAELFCKAIFYNRAMNFDSKNLFNGCISFKKW